MRKFFLGISIALLGTSATTDAQQPAPAFRFERPVVGGGEGPHRLAVDVPLLVGSSPFRIVSRTRHPRTGDWNIVVDGLRDLRLYDANGREIAYLLVRNPPIEPVYHPAAILAVAPVVAENQKTSGFEADLGAVLRIDRFRLDGLPAPFLKRVRLEASGDRERWTLVVPSSTVFDLPAEQLRHTELRFAAGSYRYLRLTWDDTNSARMPAPPAVVAGEPGAADTIVPLTGALTFERRPSEPGVSRFRVRLASGRLPIVALDLNVGGGHVLRDATVYEARLSSGQLAPVPLGSATLKRVVRDDLTAAALQIPIEPPTEASLDLVVNDGDNPPLELTGVTAVFAPLPWIYFEATPGALTARYGNSTLNAPRYDLEATRAEIKIDEVPDAAWGDVRARTAEENTVTATPALPTTGAPLDTSRFTYQRTVPEGAGGLISVQIDAAVLAHSEAGSFRDVRVIDAGGRQVPYLVERASEPLTLTASVDRLAEVPKALAPARGVRSTYRVQYPFAELPATRLVLTTPARIFDRAISVVVTHEADSHRRDPRLRPSGYGGQAWIETLTQAKWIHAMQDRPAAPLTLPIPTVRATDLIVVVDEGDNSPLPLESAQILLPSYHLRLFREPAAPLRLVYGREDLAPPQYDLALLAPQVLGATAEDVALGPEQPLAQSSTLAPGVSPRFFWAVIGAAVIVLLALIVRLLRKSEITP